jgi:succinoglycan biosynthesis protein ExoL
MAFLLIRKMPSFLPETQQKAISGVNVTYFAHDMSDFAVRRRVAMLQAGGAKVSLFGFTRAEAGVTDVEGAPAVIFSRTFDGKLYHRAKSAMGAIFKLGRHRQVLMASDVIIGRNLEMLVVAWAAHALYARKARLIYECLDIHPAMVGNGVMAKVLRAVERALISRCQLIITSSPAFVRNYFQARQNVSTPIALLENKVLRLDGEARIGASCDRAAPPWRIGWYGIHRTQKALDIICKIATDNPDLGRFVIRGRPGLIDFDDFHGQIAATPNVEFDGAYGPHDLARIYSDVHFNWAFDFFDEGSNSAWLLPNRIYEGGLYGAIPLAKRSTETGRWLAARGLGFLTDDPARDVPDFLKGLTAERYAEYTSHAQALALSDVVASRADCVALVSLIGGKP